MNIKPNPQKYPRLDKFLVFVVGGILALYSAWIGDPYDYR
jgi:hypothetical protein